MPLMCGAKILPKDLSTMENFFMPNISHDFVIVEAHLIGAIVGSLLAFAKFRLCKNA